MTLKRDETLQEKRRGDRRSALPAGQAGYGWRVPSSNKMIQLIINVEAQGKLNTGYPMVKRGIYHCSRMISAQHGTEFIHSEYQKIKKVYSIFVCMTPPKKRQNNITRYRLVEENLIGNVKKPVRNYGLLSVVMLCLGGRCSHVGQRHFYASRPPKLFGEMIGHSPQAVG